MHSIALITTWLLFCTTLASQTIPKLYIQIVSHNEPNDNFNQPLRYAKAKKDLVQLANIVDSKNAKWNLQTPDGLVFGARQDEISTGGNIFEQLANAPYRDNIEIDPRSKNNPGRNIADQWYLLDSLGARPSKTVGGFIYYVCPPNSSSLIDWWQYTDTITGLYYGNKIKFQLLSGAGSLAPHCNDLNDFGIFKPDTTTRFYTHNPARNLWCIGTGCAPLLDSAADEQAIIDLIQSQVDLIQKRIWPSDKFYVTRIMTNQREYGPMFFQKMAKVIDSLNLIPSTQLKWATLSEAFADFEFWQESTNREYSQWLCNQTSTRLLQRSHTVSYRLYPNPFRGVFNIEFDDSMEHQLAVFDLTGRKVSYKSKILYRDRINLSGSPLGTYFIQVDDHRLEKVVLL
ncbi:MAG TPA: T9SS type A sorting domain-containing protein [Saprospiraceae bacterium]|nr:T9SS type A sorting domain-containing protein [Saprospiraceae bacterium]HNT21102.1 T9SS type A sorting domain-containing protein [Saprospiraceae bacterium]